MIEEYAVPHSALTYGVDALIDVLGDLLEVDPNIASLEDALHVRDRVLVLCSNHTNDDRAMEPACF